MRVLWLKSELLHPIDKGGKIRTFEMLKRLKSDHDITYLCLADPGRTGIAGSLAEEYCHKLILIPFIESPRSTLRFYRDLLGNAGSRLPFAIEKYRSESMRQAIEKEMSSDRYDIVVSDFLVPSINLPAAGGTPTVLFQHNVESIVWRRNYESQTSLIRKAYFRAQWQRMLAYEEAACRRFDAVVTVSAADRDFIRDRYRVREVYDVPTGVDTEYFRPQGSKSTPTGLVFTGSMDWMPNEDAVLYFNREILPRIHDEIPEARFTIAGRNPGGAVRALQERDQRVRVTGDVPDIRPYIRDAAVYVAPIRAGGGTRLKIFEAMSMAKPVVSTLIGAEGLPVDAGEELLIASDPAQFASEVIRLLRDRDLARRIGARARVAVCERFSWENASASFARICERVLARLSRVKAA